MPSLAFILKVTSLLLVTAGMSGCMHSLVWSEANFSGTTLRVKRVEGALNVNNERPPIQSRCGPDLNPVGSSCAYGFVDSNGEKVDVFQLVKRLDRRAEEVPELKRWVARGATNYRAEAFPYKLYLVTISPAVVLVVPRTGDGFSDLCRSLLLEGCAQSQAFPGNGYWFQGVPRIAPGSFWFSLEDRNVHPIDAGAREFEISHEMALLRFTSNGGQWSISRTR